MNLAVFNTLRATSFLFSIIGILQLVSCQSLHYSNPVDQEFDLQNGSEDKLPCEKKTLFSLEIGSLPVCSSQIINPFCSIEVEVAQNKVERLAIPFSKNTQNPNRNMNEKDSLVFMSLEEDLDNKLPFLIISIELWSQESIVDNIIESSHGNSPEYPSLQISVKSKKFEDYSTEFNLLREQQDSESLQSTSISFSHSKQFNPLVDVPTESPFTKDFDQYEQQQLSIYRLDRIFSIIESESFALPDDAKHSLNLSINVNSINQTRKTLIKEIQVIQSNKIKQNNSNCNTDFRPLLPHSHEIQESKIILLEPSPVSSIRSSNTVEQRKLSTSNNCDKSVCSECVNSTICTKCKSPFTNVHGTCVLCGAGTEIVSLLTEPYCRKVLHKNGCSNYDSTLGICKGCFSGYHLATNCNQNVYCADTTKYDISSLPTCGSCSANDTKCIKCATNNQCMQCQPGYKLAFQDYKQLNSNVICVSACATGFYEDSKGFCAPCGMNCDTCSNSSTTCTKCKTGFIADIPYNLINSTYKQRCTPSYSCSANCTTCSPLTLVCTACASGYANVFGSCQKCGAGCLECTSSTNCTKCINGATNTPTCAAFSCSERYFLNDSYACEACKANCHTCTNADQCDVCMPGYVQEMYSCFACPTDCLICSDRNTCTSCRKGYDLAASGDSCSPSPPPAVTCATNTFYDGSNCIPCNPNCTECIDSTRCTACVSGKTPVNGVCISCTSTQFYANDVDGCQECPTNCANCQDFSGCTECNSGFYYNSSNDTCMPHSYCGDGNIGLPMKTTDGTLFTKECDDKNLLNNDGCSNTCKVEERYSCTYDNPTSKSICSLIESICGDGITSLQMRRKSDGTLVTKECDDKNVINNDGCSDDCKVEERYSCSYDNLNNLSVCVKVQSVCGDGDTTLPYKDINGTLITKECDDQNLANNDGCNNTCKVEDKYSCLYDSVGKKSICSKIESVCGDGDMTLPAKISDGSVRNKTCDDRNVIAGDGCDDSCQIEDGYACEYDNNNKISNCSKKGALDDGQSFHLESKVDSETLNAIVIVRFQHEIVRSRLLLGSEEESLLSEYVQSQLTVEISDTSVAWYSFTVFMQENNNQRQFEILFETQKAIVSKTVTISFSNSFIAANSLENSSAVTRFPDVRPISVEEKDAADSVATAGSVAGQAFVVSVVPAIIFSNFPILFNALDLFQMIFYLQYVNIRFPYNVQEFLYIMTKFQMPFSLNFISWILEEYPIESFQVPDTYEVNEVSGAFLDNTGDSYSQLCILITSHLILIGISKLCLKSSKNCFVKVGEFLKGKLETSWKWGWYLDMYWEMYLSIVVSISLQMYGFEVQNTQSIMNLIFFVFSLSVALITPFYFGRIIWMNRDNLNQESTKNKWGMLYEQLRINNVQKISPATELPILPIVAAATTATAIALPIPHQKATLNEIKSVTSLDNLIPAQTTRNNESSSMMMLQNGEQNGSQKDVKSSSNNCCCSSPFNALTACKFFYVVLYVRKIFFGSVIVFFWEIPMVQLVCIDIYNAGILIFLFYAQPFESKVQNIKAIICEIAMIIAQISLKFLIDDSDENNESNRMKIGWIFIFCCVGILLLQITFIFANIASEVKKQFIEWFSKKQVKNNQRELRKQESLKILEKNSKSSSSSVNGDKDVEQMIPNKVQQQNSITNNVQNNNLAVTELDISQKIKFDETSIYQKPKFQQEAKQQLHLMPLKQQLRLPKLQSERTFQSSQLIAIPSSINSKQVLECESEQFIQFNPLPSSQSLKQVKRKRVNILRNPSQFFK